MTFPVHIEMNGQKYRIQSLCEAAGPHINKPDSVFLSVRAEWLLPYVGWKQLRNINILGELRKIYDGLDSDTR